MASTPGFVGQRLTEARRARALNAADFAALVGVSAVSISKYENGHQTPRPETAHAIADALKMPRAYFFRKMSKEDERPVFWRARLSSPPAMRDRAGIRLEWMKEVVDYLAGYFDFPPLNIPELTTIDNVKTIGHEFLEEAANAIRVHWNIRPGPMPDVIEKLESNGILVSRIHVDAEKLDAFSQWSDRFGVPFVVLSRDKASAVRQRFDALHELAHITIHKNVSQRRLNDTAFYKAIESQADKLAGCLLLPAKEFLDDLFAPSLDGFLALKERWGASVGAMIMRCQELDIIDEWQAKRMWINYNRRGWRDGEPLDSKMQKESPFVIRRGFELLIAEKVQSAAEIMAALPFPPSDLEEIADLDPGTLTGHVESKPEPVLKPEFRNVVSLFDKRR